MGVKFEWKSAELVISTAESLRKATEQLTQVAAEMQQHHPDDYETLCRIPIPAHYLDRVRPRLRVRDPRSAPC